MTLQEFKNTVSASTPPAVSPLLQAMWYDAKGDWNAAHNIAQDIHTHDGSWVHGYLHRKEGDESNAAYWYHRANKAFKRNTLSEEWNDIVTALL
ncbi:hypothetical protein [Pseudochryseolinea flava]|uniref:Uncharacterized protein n=1 Tax=Pseudochryseolinea flava TaxID=2059302 RepID=A0A364XZX8_9BACT|nr:hypothetical protein [Pseudochryseolinea flava]RAV99934.1 hypothetical protein DQQ10_17750 [Pseudochryseolinea flava]